jgi:hypothetical protein
MVGHKFWEWARHVSVQEIVVTNQAQGLTGDIFSDIR